MADVGAAEPQPVPALRPELRFFPRVQDGTPELLLEDPLTLRFYRIGEREHAFMTRIDGRRTAGEALAAANRELEAPLDQDEAAEILRFLYREGLLRTRGELSRKRLETVKRHKLFGTRLRRLNAIFLRIPLGNPDRLLNRLLPYVRMLVGPGALPLLVAVWAGGLYQLLADPVRLGQSAAGVLYPSNWIWLGLAWLALKVLHELFHGLVSKYYGGQVYEAGVVLVLFMPIGYVDATPSWRFPSRWQRIHTAAAGMIAELTAAGIAAWVWASLPPGAANDLAFNVILIGGVSTLLFNANPLMRFDGYFILTDLVGIPNLYLKGQQYLRYLGRRHLLGMPDIWQPGTTAAKDLFIRAYGVLALVWRLTVFAVILVAAGELFYGLGIVLAALGVAAFVAVPVWRLILLMKRGANGVRPSPRRYLPRLVVAGVGITILMGQVAWSSSLRVPAVVRDENIPVVRVKTPGFVREVHVADGQPVQAGTPLISLYNPEIEADLATLAGQLGEAQIRARSLLLRARLPAYQAEQEELAALRRQLDELESRRDELVLRAPRDGRVRARRLPDLLGTYVKIGSEILSVVGEEGKELRLSVSAADLPLLTLSPGDEVAATFPGRGGQVFHGRVKQTAPRASTRVDMPMLAAINGGPLPVRPRTSDDADAVARETEGFEYVEPRVTLDTSLDAEDSQALRAGEVGWARLPTAPRPLGDRVLKLLQDWFEHMMQRRTDAL